MDQTYTNVPLDKLKLDYDNPRLPKIKRRSSDQEIVEWLLSDASLTDLMLAIGTNGFFAGEPLLVIEESNNYIVVEGNRRLASVMLLSEVIKPSTQKNRVEQIVKASNYFPKEIPCIVFSSKSDIESYLGFRHVTGIKEWSPLAKARYLTNLISTTYQDEFNAGTYREVAKQIGSRMDYVKRLISSYKIFEIIESRSFYNIPNLSEETLHFSYIMDSLGKPTIRNYLHIDFSIDDPISDFTSENEVALEQLIKWFFEQKPNGKTALIGDSTHLGMLSDVLDNTVAKERFLETNDLRDAHDLTIDREEGFRNLLKKAQLSLEDAWNQSLYLDNYSDLEKEYLSKIIMIANKINK